MEPNKKVLAVVTNHPTYKDGESTGLWISELTHFYDALTSAGYRVDIASPKGGLAPLDPGSVSLARLDMSARSFMDSPEKKELLAHTLALADVQPEGYAAVFFAGGHGAMWDFNSDPNIQRTITHIYQSGGVVSAVCHGVAALLSATDVEGKLLVSGHSVTGYSTLEEQLAGAKKKIPYFLEKELAAKGGRYSRGWFPFTPYVVADGRLVTGQNPQSTKKMSKVLLKLLK
jgi:putative intracellular protease/amidase